MFTRSFSVLLILVMALLQGCSSVDVRDYAAEQPRLDLARYFNGTIDAWGVFQDRGGRVVRRFTVRIEARWEGDTGILDEHFEYSDGERQRRVWTIRRQTDGRYWGTAEDVVGTAVGESAGNALRWRYVLALPVDGRTYQVDFDDWMWLMDEDTLLNRSVMSKWGFRLGEVTLAFRKRRA